MFKTRLLSLLLIAFILISPTAVFGQASLQNIDKSQLSDGIISINYEPTRPVKTKVMISKGDIKYTYNLDSNNTLPLQSGDGEYEVSIWENVKGNTYRLSLKEKIVLKSLNKNRVFTQSVQNINWNEDMDSVKKAKELTQDARTDKEKVIAVYNYIVENVKYDYNKAKTLKTDYLPSIDSTMKMLKGICYDYSSLFASMMRSLGIPTKLVMGYKNDIQTYHAWNQVYLETTNKWVIIDTTYDSIMVQNNIPVLIFKKEKEYLTEKEY